MTNAPYLLPKARGGMRMGHAKVLDHMFLDGLEDAYDKGKLMGVFAEQAAEAHARVAKLFGKATTTPSDIKADGAKASDRTKIPTTLGSLPAAAAANLTDDATIDDLGDDPDLAEAKWSQMPTSKRSAVLRATLPNNRR